MKGGGGKNPKAQTISGKLIAKLSYYRRRRRTVISVLQEDLRHLWLFSARQFKFDGRHWRRGEMGVEGVYRSRSRVEIARAALMNVWDRKLFTPETRLLVFNIRALKLSRPRKQRLLGLSLYPPTPGAAGHPKG